jgi:hypothetical protein
VDDAGMRAAVEATVDAGTAYYEMLMESVPAGVMRDRIQGVCDFARRREASHTVTDVPADISDTFHIIDGGVVYTQEDGDRWDALDMGGWGSSGGLLWMLGWLYGVVDARAGDSGEHIVTLSAARAVEVCPPPLRDELRRAFSYAGHLDAVATGWVRTDAANRVTECRLDLPGQEDGLFGSVDVGCRVTLSLSDFGEPASIQPPDAGPAMPVEDYVEEIFRRIEESE